MADARADDNTILREHDLWRRIPPWHLVPDSNAGNVRISKAAFEDDMGGDPMSVTLAQTATDLGITHDQVLAGHEGFGLAALSAGTVRDRAQRIVRDPQPNEPAHGLVIGNKTDGNRKAFAKAARWVAYPPGKTILGLNRLPLEWTVGVTEQTAYVLLLPGRQPPQTQPGVPA